MAEELLLPISYESDLPCCDPKEFSGEPNKHLVNAYNHVEQFIYGMSYNGTTYKLLKYFLRSQQAS